MQRSKQSEHACGAEGGKGKATRGVDLGPPLYAPHTARFASHAMYRASHVYRNRHARLRRKRQPWPAECAHRSRQGAWSNGACTAHAGQRVWIDAACVAHGAEWARSTRPAAHTRKADGRVDQLAPSASHPPAHACVMRRARCGYGATQARAVCRRREPKPAAARAKPVTEGPTGAGRARNPSPLPPPSTLPPRPRAPPPPTSACVHHARLGGHRRRPPTDIEKMATHLRIEWSLVTTRLRCSWARISLSPPSWPTAEKSNHDSKSASEPKMSGSRKLSSDHSSDRLF